MKIFLFFSILAFIWFGLRWFENKNLYFPERDFVATPAQYGLLFDDVHFQTQDGTRLSGWFIPSKHGGLTLLYCHGNAGNISHRMDKTMIFHRLGLSVFLFDYRGFGLSQGRPSEKGTYQDAEAACRYLTEEKKISAEKIVYYGESLGGAMAIELVRQKKGAGLILESTFTSIVDMTRRLFPLLPARWIVKNRYDNLSKMSEIKIPTLFMHSRQDELIPFDMAQTLFEAAQTKKTIFELTGAHNDGFMQTGIGYEKALELFFKSLSSLKTAYFYIRMTAS